tara:strand:+ start:221 stop:742 length:522 start_codon:yes stop_codon:yes gene_type:complete
MSYKKWIHKYKFLQEDLVDTKDQLENYIQTFNEDFSIEVDENEPPKPIGVDPLPERISDNQCKPIFKRLSKTLHPDKGGNNEDFIKISDSYRNQDIIGLYLIAEKYNIDIEDLITDEILPLFESSCIIIEEQISQKTKTIAWDWCNITDPKQKETVIKYLKDEHNIVPKEKPS